MATTCRDIVVPALRRIGIVAAGREPSAAMAEEAQGYLRNFYTGLLGQGVFGRMRDIRVVTDTYTALEQDRISIERDEDTTVTLPSTVTQEWTPDAGAYPNDYGFVSGGDTGYLTTITERKPRDQAVVVVVQICDGTSKAYVYDAMAGRWQRINDIELNDTAPLASRYETAIKAMMAEYFADAYGQQISDKLRSDVAMAKTALSHKWDRPRREVAGQYF